MPAQLSVVVSLDGFSIASLGPYGSWNATPEIDRLAARGSVFMRCISPTDATASNLDIIADVARDQFAQFDFRVLLTDDLGLVEKEFAERFDTVIEIEYDVPDQAHDEIQLGAATAIFSAMDEQLASVMKELKHQADGSGLVWLHSRVLRCCWDAPHWLCPMEQALEMEDEEQVDEKQVDEKQIDVETMVLALRDEEQEIDIDATQEDEEEDEEKDTEEDSEPTGFEEMGQITVPPGGPERPALPLQFDTDPDAALRWMHLYACQIRAIDLLLQMLWQQRLQSQFRSPKAMDVQWLLMGTSGFPLGEHGWVGYETKTEHEIDADEFDADEIAPTPRCPFRSVQLMVPFLVVGDRRPEGHFPEPISLPHATKWFLKDANPNLDALPFDEAIHSHSVIDGSVAVTTADWFCIWENLPDDAADADADSSQSARLFLKPDDRWDCNDVADRRSDVISQLAAKRNEKASAN